MKQYEVESVRDLGAVLNKIRHMVQLAFTNSGLSKAFIAISREPFEIRSNDQNALMWPLLTDFSHQVEHGNRKYSPDQWKEILTAAFEDVYEYAPSLDGQHMVAFGARTSKYTKKKMSQFIEFIYAEGCERGVDWSQRSSDSLEEARK
ncbi:hypothetical protein A3765_28600 [Oleiphilus sp. HI0130]|nr:hypothetical protein A3765_28885 [Oleiphilus sp. HI0130]KZZ72513.1 hypothetical protein A3765_28600 [Oleiphilus sp. HI0130]